MSDFNWFGSTAASCANLFASNAADYGDASNILTDAGGTAAVEMDMSDIEEEMISLMCQEVYRGLMFIRYEDLTLDGTRDGTTFNLGVNPVDTSKPITIWRYDIDRIGNKGFSNLCGGGLTWPLEPECALDEGASLDYTVATAAGITSITLTETMARGGRLFASYHTDTSSTSFSIKSLAMILEIGVAARVGSRLYSEGTPSWDLVTYYRDRYASLIEKIQDCSYIPSHIRNLTFHRPIEPDSGHSIQSVPFFRG